MQRVILVWYLPGILGDSRQVGSHALSDHQIKYNVFQREMMATTAKLHKVLEKQPEDLTWRSNDKYYPPGTEGPQGAVNLSPAWYAKGHEVNCFGM
jgi:hypothetical protein